MALLSMTSHLSLNALNIGCLLMKRSNLSFVKTLGRPLLMISRRKALFLYCYENIKLKRENAQLADRVRELEIKQKTP